MHGISDPPPDYQNLAEIPPPLAQRGFEAKMSEYKRVRLSILFGFEITAIFLVGWQRGSPSWAIIELFWAICTIAHGHQSRRYRYPDLSDAETATKELNVHSSGLVFPRLGRIVQTRHLEMVARATRPVQAGFCVGLGTWLLVFFAGSAAVKPDVDLKNRS